MKKPFTLYILKTGGGRGAYYKAKYGGGGSHKPREHPIDPRSNEIDGPRNNDQERKRIRTSEDLFATLRRINRSQYGAYKELKGEFIISQPFQYTLGISYIQGDPYAPPSHCYVRIPLTVAGYPTSLYSNKIRKIALADYLTREFCKKIKLSGAHNTMEGGGGGWKGSKGGDIKMEKAGQHVIERSSVQIFDAKGYIEARLTVGLPASG